MFQLAPRPVQVSLVVAAALLVAACGSTVVSPSPAASPVLATFSPTITPALPSISSLPSISAPAAPASPVPDTTGFAFAAQDIAAYYATQGYTCTTPQPSTKAAGFSVRSCDRIDSAGRTQVIGLVTDPVGGLANAFASVKGTERETVLAPIDALDSLSGFLGTTLGEEQGGALLTWLASHLGDAFAETTTGRVKVATYTESADDHSTLYVEIANQAYLDASPAPAPPSPVGDSRVDHRVPCGIISVHAGDAHG